MDHFWEEAGLDMFLFIEHIDTLEYSGVLESGEVLLVSGGNVRRGCHGGSGRGCMEVRDILRGCAVAHSTYGG